MLKHFLTIGWRNLIKNRIFTIINISGLALGIAGCILASLFIKDELSYDKQNKNADRIYRIVTDFINEDGSKFPEATTPPSLSLNISKEIPEIETATRLFTGSGMKFYVRKGNKKFIEENVYHAEESLFKVFTIPFLRGDPKTALNNPDAVILTASMAKKYFGQADPIGQSMEIDDWEPRVVTAVVKDVPDNSHFKFDFLVPLKRFLDDRATTNWGWQAFYTYIKVRPGADIKLLDEKIKKIKEAASPGNNSNFHTQSLTSIHLYSNLKDELKPNSDRNYLYFFAALALFILVIACINYINLTTANSSFRAKEIGIRKVAGALRSSLIRLFLTESVLTTLLAGILALLAAQLFLPVVNRITDKNLSIIPQSGYYLMAVSIVCLLVGTIAGIYPALYLSSFNPVKVLKGRSMGNLKTLSTRKLLVVTQFSISITLIIGAIVINNQIHFIQHAKLGLDKDNVIIVNAGYGLPIEETSNLKNDWLRIKGVKSVSATDGVIVEKNWAREVTNKGSENEQLINFISVDTDFIGSLHIEMKEGRNFRTEQIDNDHPEVILNEAAVRQLNIPNPAIGRQILWAVHDKPKKEVYATIVGIVRDFHFSSMKNEIKPFAFAPVNHRKWNYTIKMAGSDISETLSSLKHIWDKNVISRPFQYTFLDETYSRLYTSEMKFKQIFMYTTYIAIFISCLGLFGLSSFIIEQRAREIGIRKVLGASAAKIAAMLTGEFLSSILFALLIAFPLAWWAMHSWLQNFAYRVSINWWIFALASALSLLIASLTICFQAIKAAVSNPIKSLKME